MVTIDGRIDMLPPGMVKARALLHNPFCWTCTTPVNEPEATAATICVSFQLVMSPSLLPMMTTPPPWVAPKPVPAIVTCVPHAPEVGVREVMCGAVPMSYTPADTLLFVYPLAYATALSVVTAFRLIGPL